MRIANWMMISRFVLIAALAVTSSCSDFDELLDEMSDSATDTEEREPGPDGSKDGDTDQPTNDDERDNDVEQDPDTSNPDGSSSDQDPQVDDPDEEPPAEEPEPGEGDGDGTPNPGADPNIDTESGSEPNDNESDEDPPSDMPEEGCDFDWERLKSESIQEKIVLPAPESESTTYIKCNQSGSDSVVRIGSYRTTVWTSDSFKGNFCTITSFDAKTLTVHINGSGGFDIGPSVSGDTSGERLRVDDIHPDVTISARLDQNFVIPEQKWGPFWKAGPKLGVRSCPSPSECPGDTWDTGWFENYVIEDSSWTEEEVTNMLAKGKYLGETTQDGGVYKHYLRDHPTHGKWKQFWAIRQNFRSSGTVHVKPIYEFWRKHGLPNGYVNWVKYNIELHKPPEGGWCGTLKISDYESPADWRTNK